MNKFCIWTPSGQRTVRCSVFSKLRVYVVYSNLRPQFLFGEHCEILRPTHMVDMENVEEMVGTREAVAVATESSGAATRWGRRLMTRWQRPVG